MATRTLTFRLDDSLLPQLEAEAEAHGCPRATYLQRIVDNHLTKDQAEHATKKLLEETTEVLQLLQTLLQDTHLIKQIVAQKSREQSREFSNITEGQRALRGSLATAFAALLESVCRVSREEALGWAKEHMT